MGKRPSRGPFGPPDSRKRQKVAREPPTSEDVTNSRQLKKLLEFHQDVRNARHGLQSFKLLLDALTSNASHEEELRLLTGYLDAVKPEFEEPDAVYLPDIMEMWSFAAHTSNEDLMSEVAAVLALLLHATSLSLPLVPYGRAICETLLQERHLKLAAKNLSADKDRGFVISPALRLLREVAAYDGGVFARRVFRAQALTFAEVSRNLDIRYRAEGVEDARRPSVRTNAVRLLLACLKYLPSENRTELLMQKGLMPALLMRLPDDPPALIHEALDCLIKSVLLDEKIPSHTKSRVFWAKPMDRLVGLYAYAHDPPDSAVTVADKAHDFLMLACSSPTAGIVSKCNGLYPATVKLDDFSAGGAQWSGMGLEQLSWMDQYAREVPVRNNVLLEVSLKLRPWASVRQGELLVAIFGAAPELVGAYFLEQRSFTFDPKLSMTWVGYASFLYSAMQLPVPEFFGLKGGYHAAPPPTSVLLDSIIPLPLTQSALLRCFEPKWPLVSLFATRLLIRALEKLEAVLAMHREAAAATGTAAGSPWRHAESKLVGEFCRRMPDMKEVVRWYKSVPEGSILCRATAARLLLLYYRVLPQVALAANFDVSPLLAKTLATLGTEFEDLRDKALVLMELESLLEVASLSPGMRWFAKLPGFPASPFTVLLKLGCGEVEGFAPEKLRRILESVAVEQQVVLADTGLEPISRAVAALKKADTDVQLDAVWAFLDTCITKCATSPMKYLDLIPGYVESASQSGEDINLSLLAISVAEQLPFASKSASKADLGLLARFVSAFAGYSIAAGENKAWMKALLQKMNSSLPAESGLRLKISKDVAKESIQKEDTATQPKQEAATKGDREPGAAPIDAAALEELLHEPFADPEDNSALTKWVTKSIDDVLEDGHAVALIRLLGSPHASIRMEALTNILKLAAKLRASTHPEKDQLWLLLSELAESSRPHVPTSPAPSAFPAFAIHALPVLLNPLHALYPKVNKYLTRAPRWPDGKIPLVHDVLHGEPSDDDRYYAELGWLFEFLLDCLVRGADMGVFHQTRWFEKVFAAACNPYMKAGLRSRVFRVLYRATCIEGGSTTLVTRFGVLSWLEGLRVGEVGEEAVVGALMGRVWGTCDRGHVGRWSRGAIPKMMRAVEGVAG